SWPMPAPLAASPAVPACAPPSAADRPTLGSETQAGGSFSTGYPQPCLIFTCVDDAAAQARRRGGHLLRPRGSSRRRSWSNDVSMSPKSVSDPRRVRVPLHSPRSTAAAIFLGCGATAMAVSFGHCIWVVLLGHSPAEYAMHTTTAV